MLDEMKNLKTVYFSPLMETWEVLIMFTSTKYTSDTKGNVNNELQKGAFISALANFVVS